MDNCDLSQRVPPLGVGWCPVLLVRLSTVADSMPVCSNRCRSAVMTHYALRTLASIRLYPTCLETRTKESNMCASLWVIETRGRNESKGSFGC